MKINKDYIKYEFKKMLADPLMNFMLFYPIMFGLIGRYLVPLIDKSNNMDLSQYNDVIIVALTLMTPLIYGALTGFSLLEDRDDHILSSIRVTPLSIHGFIWFKFIISTLLSFIACIFVISFSNIESISLIYILMISFLASLSVPFSGLLINAVANNKIEGFAAMKATGIVIILPIIALFFIDSREFYFSFAPGFWPAKSISSLIRKEGTLILTFTGYYIYGLIYILALNGLTYKLFLKKVSNSL